MPGTKPKCTRCGHPIGMHNSDREGPGPCGDRNCRCPGYSQDVTLLPCGREGCGHPMSVHSMGPDPDGDPSRWVAVDAGKGACTAGARTESAMWPTCRCPAWLSPTFSVTDGGRKDDDGKPRLDLVEAEFILLMGKLAAFGAQKYSEEGWKQLTPDRMYSALVRHALAWKAGETYDQETELPHMVAVAFNAMCVWWLTANRKDDL